MTDPTLLSACARDVRVASGVSDIVARLLMSLIDRPAVPNCSAKRAYGCCVEPMSQSLLTERHST